LQLPEEAVAGIEFATTAEGLDDRHKAALLKNLIHEALHVASKKGSLQHMATVLERLGSAVAGAFVRGSAPVA
jgi:hypothetical protein